MNNFVFSQDPLLYQNISQAMKPQPEFDPRQQFDNALAQYQQMQQALNSKMGSVQEGGKDHLGELDDMMKELDETVASKLQGNEEFTEVNSQLQSMIQEELMRGVKWKINAKPEAISKIDSLKKMIKEQAIEEKKNMMELNDYLNNYSSMSFDDYKRIKNQTKNVEHYENS